MVSLQKRSGERSQYSFLWPLSTSHSYETRTGSLPLRLPMSSPDLQASTEVPPDPKVYALMRKALQRLAKVFAPQDSTLKTISVSLLARESPAVQPQQQSVPDYVNGAGP